MLRAKTERHNIVITGSRWFDNKANVGGWGAIDLVMHIAEVDFSVACRSLADEFRPLTAGQANLSFPIGRPLAHSYFSMFFLASFRVASGVASALVAISNAAFIELQNLPI